jgi:hypothetical protein
MALRNLTADRLSGDYSPALTIVSNIAVLTLLKAFFAVSGDIVQVYFAATVDPTLASTTYTFRVSLPFGLELASVHDIIGVCGPSLGAGFGGAIKGHLASDEAIVDSAQGVDTALNLYGTFAYRMP